MLSLLRTPLYDWHCAQHAQMAEWDGWEMPKQYVSTLDEYETARKHVGVADLSHKGRLVFEGPGAGRFLNSLLSRNIIDLKPGQLHYALLINEHGGILDDLLVGYLLQEHSGAPYYYITVNAANREKVITYFKRFLTPEIMTKPQDEVYFFDETNDQSMIAVQGPNAAELLKPLFQADISTLSYYSGVETSFSFGGRWALVSRTGYAGRDGFEIVLESFFIEQFVVDLFQQGRIFNIAPIGFAAIDIMRQESAIPFYGYELDESITPFEARLTYALHLDDHDFPGNKILRNLKMKTPEKLRIGLEISGEFPACNGDEIFFEQQKIGRITSGTFSPTLQKNIAMGYVPYEFSQLGQILNVNIRNNINNAVVVPMPFINRRK
ncbi:MAG: glycine cleavage system aminomethyltransferase GcvT [Planctomycetaceae bacterium]|jgi:aminomethyltransferase|nr:glycine cleavage system aminomethyltransferase GcvT [Planctomycetaceae bacterium]